MKGNVTRSLLIIHLSLQLTDKLTQTYLSKSEISSRVSISPSSGSVLVHVALFPDSIWWQDGPQQAQEYSIFTLNSTEKIALLSAPDDDNLQSPTLCQTPS